MPGEKFLTQWGGYNDELMRLGVLLGFSGPPTSSKGARASRSREENAP